MSLFNAKKGFKTFIFLTYLIGLFGCWMFKILTHTTKNYFSPTKKVGFLKNHEVNDNFFNVCQKFFMHFEFICVLLYKLKVGVIILDMDFFIFRYDILVTFFFKFPEQWFLGQIRPSLNLTFICLSFLVPTWYSFISLDRHFLIYHKF